MKCNKCGALLKNNSKFCTVCGTKIDLSPKFCTKCGNKLSENDRFCKNCGNPINDITTVTQKKKETAALSIIINYKNIPVTEIFLLMNYIDFIYSQPLPGIIQKSKDEFYSIINIYFKKLAADMN